MLVSKKKNRVVTYLSDNEYRMLQNLCEDLRITQSAALLQMVEEYFQVQKNALFQVSDIDARVRALEDAVFHRFT